MLVFPNCKINLGLNVIKKRPDGFHNIETVFYPVGWCDALELIEEKNASAPFTLVQSGLAISGDTASNLVYKAWQIIAAQKKLPPLKAHLHKIIPMGAGLGGGSADAAFFINLLNEHYQLGYSVTEKMKIASQLGADCAFFISNQPVFAQGMGNDFSEVKVDLSGYYIVLVYPGVHSNTREAYQGLTPAPSKNNTKSIVQSQPVEQWRELLLNDFEVSIFEKYPQIQALKNNLYEAGALYASMSGSGSAVFGIFSAEPQLHWPPDYCYYVQKPAARIL